MGPIKLLAFSAILGVFSTPVFSETPDDNFNEYAEGAMSIYAKIKEPSKEESERFYSYIKSKWETTHCHNNSCIESGQNAAKEYVYVWDKELDNEVR